MSQESRFSSFRCLLSSCKMMYNNSIAIKYKDLRGSIVEKTYSEFVDEVIGTANLLYSIVGRQREKKITVLSHNRYEYIVILYACLCGAGIFTVIDFNSTIENVIDIIERLSIDVLIVDESHRLELKDRKINDTVKKLSLDSENELEKFSIVSSDTYDFDDFPISKLRLLVGTSGTSIQYQKYVMLSAKNLLTNTQAMNRDYEIGFQKVLVSLPLAHLYSIMANVIFPISHGDEIYIAKSIYDIERDLIEYNPTNVALVPMIAEGLLKKYRKLHAENENIEPKDVYGSDFSDLLIGGAMIPEELLHGYYDMGINIVRAYGMTETSTNITVTKPITEEYDFKTVGHVMSCNEVKIVDGEIWIKGDNVMMGYYQNLQLTNETVVDGWLRTGDAGYILNDGRLYITGRIKNIIVLSSGENINPEEIENIFMRDMNIDECVVFSTDDKSLSMIAYSKEYIDKPKDLIDIINRINVGLPYGHRIGHMHLSDLPLPRTTVGKIMRSNINSFCEKTIICNEIKELICERLYQREFINIHSDFKEELELTSLDMVSIWSEIEEKYRRRIDKPDFMHCRNVEDIYNMAFEK